MSQIVPPSQDQPSIPPGLADQSNNNQSSSLTHSADDVSPSTEEQPLEMHATHNNPKPGAFASHSMNIYERLFTHWRLD
jgi:hypothetical protein